MKQHFTSVLGFLFISMLDDFVIFDVFCVVSVCFLLLDLISVYARYHSYACLEHIVHDCMLVPNHLPCFVV